jgi:hypothetical protein
LLYGPNDLVSSSRVLAHLRYLQNFGIGHKTVAKHARVAKTGLAEIIWYGKQHIRRRSETRILAIKPSIDTLPRNVNIPAKETLARINQLTRWGYTKTTITRDGLGNASGGLQAGLRAIKGKTSATTVRTAVNIQKFYDLIVSMRSVWQARRGIPRRHYVYWKSRRGRKAPPTAGRLKLFPFAVTYDYNNVWPKELKEASSLHNKLRELYRTKKRQNKKGDRR